MLRWLDRQLIRVVRSRRKGERGVEGGARREGWAVCCQLVVVGGGGGVGVGGHSM